MSGAYKGSDPPSLRPAVPMQCQNGHELFKWKKLKKWQGRFSDTACDICNKDIPRGHYRLKCGEQCDYEVCVDCARQNGIDTLPPSEGFLKAAAKAASPKWKEGVSKTVDLDENKLFTEYEKLLVDADHKDATGDIYTTKEVPTFNDKDVLFVVDMQNDFLPAEDAPDGGRFGVAEGGQAAAVICELIPKAIEAGARVVATRDYHPKDHCSFDGFGGHFPPHCVQGGKGSMFYPPIEKALLAAREKRPDLVYVVFKGFTNKVDSFGGFAYNKDYFKSRDLGHGEEGEVQCHGCSLVEWTGCFALKCSSLEEDINAPPDVMAVFERKTVKDVLGPVGRLFGCGLAFDFCVLDSMLNASSSGVASDGYFLIADAARAAYIPGIGTFGSGYLSDPEEVVHKLHDGNVDLVLSTKLL